MPTPSSARGLLRALVVLLAVVPLGAVPAAQAEPGPPYTVPQAEREAALACYGSLTSSPRVPVLLVHGTGVNSEIEWDITYRPELERLGHSVCTVDLPERGDGDVQDSVQVVAFAMREMVRRSGGRKLSVLGHSQGAFQPTYALRLYPDLARHVEDFIGLAGIYHQGSAAISEECEQACPASFRQMGSDSRLLRELNRRPMPPGPAYTAIGTLVDGTVTPQPAVNRLERGVSVQIQDICPGRRWPVPEDHVLLVGDAVAYELVMDALQHAGPASPARIDRASCAKLAWDGVDLVGFLLVAHEIVLRRGATSHAEPPLRCFMLASCGSVAERGRMLDRVRAKARKDRVKVTLVANVPGRVQLVLRGKGVRKVVVRKVAAGRTTWRLRRPAAARTLEVRTMPLHYSRFLLERQRRLR